MKTTATAAWSVTGLAAASVVAVSVGIGLQGGATAAPLPRTAPLVSAATTPQDQSRPAAAGALRRASRTAQAGEDLRGPCDEAEHAGDPRCTTAAPALRRPARALPRVAGEDISGPCDEAEHATDPRCTGAARNDDRRGGDDDGLEAGEDRRGHDRGGDDDSGGRGDDSRGDDSGGDDSASGSSGHGGSGHGGSGR